MLFRSEDEEARVAIVSGELGAGSFDPSQVALVSEGRDALDGPRGSEPPTVERAGADRPRQFRVKTSQPCMLVFSESYYPWWRARIDGVDHLPERVNLAMVGVRLPAGEHVVEFRLQPTSVWQGLAVSVVALAILGGLLMWLVSRTRLTLGGL